MKMKFTMKKKMLLLTTYCAICEMEFDNVTKQGEFTMLMQPAAGRRQVVAVHAWPWSLSPQRAARVPHGRLCAAMIKLASCKCYDMYQTHVLGW